MRSQSSRTAFVALASSTSLVVVTWKILQWRARTRARETVDRVKNLVKEGSLIDYKNDLPRERILNCAIRRASKWMSLSEENFQPMVGQVGGKSKEKKTLLTMEPDYVLKPLRADHRGIREIAFYEAIRTLSKTPTNQAYSVFLTGKDFRNSKKNMKNALGELFDTAALAFAMLLDDPVVTESEVALREGWKTVKREVDALQRVIKFTCPYYGVLGQRSVSACPDTPFGVSNDSFVLLTDVTNNFSKPCVMDLKMGTLTYEPDAPEEKKYREYNKYPQQEKFGFRIVGTRYWNPSHPDADDRGFCNFAKEFGRSLAERDELKEALRVFFSAGIEARQQPTNQSEESNKSNEEKQINSGNSSKQPKRSERVRTGAISNLLAHLRPLRRWFDDNKSLTFTASSILIVYEGDSSRDTGTKDAASVTMIDFGRVRRCSCGDPGYTKGLSSLKHLLTEILEEEEEWLQSR